MSLFLCVDCGGTKTSAVICDSLGVILGRALGGPSNLTYLTLDAFKLAVSEAVSNALNTALGSPTSPISLPISGPTPFAAAWFGISGADSPAVIANVTPTLSDLLCIPTGPRLRIVNDTHLLAAPVRMHSDVSQALAVIAGTGSIAVSFAEVDDNIEELGRVGGWGWILGDEGGGFHVGRETVRQMLMDYDEASVGDAALPSSVLKDRILEKFGVINVMEILTGVYLPDPPSSMPAVSHAHPHLLPREQRLSTLSPLVFTAAFVDADPFALRVLRACAETLASQISILLGDATNTRPRLVRAQDCVLCFGGSLVGNEKYRKMILDNLALRGHSFAHIEFVDDAAATGAVGLAASYQHK